MESITIELPFPPSVNGLYAGKGRRYQSKAYKAWLKQCPKLEQRSPWKRCFILYGFYFPDERERDGQSYFKATTDYLVKQGVIKDDNRKIVKSEAWLDFGLDRENPRVLIKIFPYNGVVFDESAMVSLAHTLGEG